MAERLSALDASFLRVETPNAHMHVAWSGVFAVDPDRSRPSLEALRASIAGRLQHIARFRQRLAFPPRGFGEPYWVDDEDFSIDRHVSALTAPDEPVGVGHFAALADGVLSTPLDRSRPLWHVYLPATPRYPQPFLSA